MITAAEAAALAAKAREAYPAQFLAEVEKGVISESARGKRNFRLYAPGWVDSPTVAEWLKPFGYHHDYYPVIDEAVSVVVRW